jgi:hypothetical protein
MLRAVRTTLVRTGCRTEGDPLGCESAGLELAITTPGGRLLLSTRGVEHLAEAMLGDSSRLGKYILKGFSDPEEIWVEKGSSP